MFSRPMINLGGTMQVVDMTTGQVTEKPSGMMLLPAAPGKCPECAADHPPELPHNRDSLFYQMRFHAEHKRWPVWADALAHCDEVMRAAWESELRSRGVPVEVAIADQNGRRPGRSTAAGRPSTSSR